jgi:tetratricopeptide (TPR) repeat protein
MTPELQTRLGEASRLRETGHIRESIAAYREVLSAVPELPDSWYNLGWLLRRANDPNAALEAYAKALAFGVDGPEEVHLNRGVVYADDLADPHRAAAEYRAALAINPTYVAALFNLGNTLEDIGDRDGAVVHYARIMQIAPDEPEPLARLANLAHVTRVDDELIVRLEVERSRRDLPPVARATLEHALGRLLDQVGEYDRAFEAHRTANIAHAAARPRHTGAYDPAAQDAFVNRLIGLPAALPADLPPSAIRPIFILGQFRSGSTLLEQILSAHSQITTAGELPFLHAMATQSLLPYPQAMSDLTPQSTAEYRAAYLRLLQTRLPDAHGLVTDKRPDNFYHIGLILRLFPNAKILHTIRDARDVCLSTWFTQLDHSLLHAARLEDIAHQYRAYERLMAHWKTIAPAQILDVQYERLVQSPEIEIRRALDFLELGFEANCLEFHKSAAPVKTASVWQVREPFYTTSSGRWQNYQKHLGPLNAALGLG